MTYYYFNTNPFVRWAESRATYPQADHVKIGQKVQAIVADDDSVAVLSEITIAEFFNTVCTLWRDTSLPRYDAAWAESAQIELMRWVDNGDLIVLEQPPKLIERAVHYVTLATREHGANLRAWDAAHLYHASYWARQLGEKVSFVTNDGDFKKIVDIYPEFKEFIDILDPAL